MELSLLLEWALNIYLLQVQQQFTGVQENLVGGVGKHVGYFSRSFDLPQSEKRRVVCDSLADKLGTFCLAL